MQPAAYSQLPVTELLLPGQERTPPKRQATEPSLEFRLLCPTARSGSIIGKVRLRRGAVSHGKAASQLRARSPAALSSLHQSRGACA